MKPRKVYLGDSVYVEGEDGRLKLTTENGYGPSNTIYLDSEVWMALGEVCAIGGSRIGRTRRGA